MYYPELIALIDAEIARLDKARKLLLPVETSSKEVRTPKRQRQVAPSMPADTPKGLPEDEHSALTSDSPPLVKRLKRVAGRRTLKVSRKLTIAPATALSGPVPRGPVFVSAEQMRREQTRKQQLEQEDGRALKVAAPSAPTAELLMQKWLPAQRMSASRS